MENGFNRAGTLFQIATANNAVVAIVLPTSNLYGIIIRTCTLVLNSPAATPAQGSLVADTTAPAGSSSGRVIAFGLANPSVSAVQVVPYQIFVPPGLGLWWATNAAAVGSSAILTYDLVQPS